MFAVWAALAVSHNPDFPAGVSLAYNWDFTLGTLDFRLTDRITGAKASFTGDYGTSGLIFDGTKRLDFNSKLEFSGTIAIEITTDVDWVDDSPAFPFTLFECNAADATDNLVSIAGWNAEHIQWNWTVIPSKPEPHWMTTTPITQSKPPHMVITGTAEAKTTSINMKTSEEWDAHRFQRWAYSAEPLDVLRDECYLGGPGFKGTVSSFKLYMILPEPTPPITIGWQFNNAPFDTIPSTTTPHVDATLKDGATRTLTGVTTNPGYIALDSITFGETFTFEMLFRGVSEDTTESLFSRNTPATPYSIQFDVSYPNTLNLTFFFVNDEFTVSVVGTSLANKWAHVIFVVDTENTPDGTLTVYVNGTSWGSASLLDHTQPYNTYAGFELGSGFKGEIREFNIYKVAMSQSDVETVFNRVFPFNVSLLFAWDFKEISYPYYTNPEYTACGTPNAGFLRSVPPSSSALVCSPMSNAGGQPTGCSPYPPYPDFRQPPGRIDHLTTVGEYKDFCVMVCSHHHEACPQYGASECTYSQWTGGVGGTKVCMHPVGQGVYYATPTSFRATLPWSSGNPSPVVTVMGTYVPAGVHFTVNKAGVSNLGGIPDYYFNGAVSIETQVYIGVHSLSPDATVELLACDQFSLTVKTGGTMTTVNDPQTFTWTSDGHDDVYGSYLHSRTPSSLRQHVVVTVGDDGMTNIYVNSIIIATGPSVAFTGVGSGLCKISTVSAGVDSTMASLKIYDGAMSHAEVHTAFHHCAEEAPAPPAPAASAEESGDPSAATVVAIVVTVLMDAAIASVVVASTVVVSIAVREITHAKRN